MLFEVVAVYVPAGLSLLDQVDICQRFQADECIGRGISDAADVFEMIRNIFEVVRIKNNRRQVRIIISCLDVFNMMLTKIIGKYVVDDLGSKTYMNFGTRYTNGIMLC